MRPCWLWMGMPFILLIANVVNLCGGVVTVDLSLFFNKVARDMV